MQGLVVKEGNDKFLVTPRGKIQLSRKDFEYLPEGTLMEARIIVVPKHRRDKIKYGVMKD